MVIDDLFTQVFGEHFLRYVYDKDKGTSADDHILSTLIDYKHDQWESLYLNQQTATLQDTPAKPKHPTSHKGSKRLLIGSKGSPKEKVILLGDEDDIDEEIGPSDSGEQQLSSAIFTASTQADIITRETATAQQDTPVISHGAGHPINTLIPHKSHTVGNETSKENFIMLDDDDTDEEISPSDGTGQQLSSAISMASTRAQLATPATLIPPVSPASASPTLVWGHDADSDSLFTNPFSIAQRPCRAINERAETLLLDERDKGKMC